MSPEYAPERLNELLSLILGEPVTIKEMLPNDSTRIADETSLVILDIVVQLKDGSIANVEVQKIGYMFPGQRAACYSADLLQRYIFIPLDIFINMLHNKGINNRLDAWFTFLSSDMPEDIISLIDKYPDFKPLYDEVYSMCLNTEKVMQMFSKELAELDKNTVQYMIDEMQSEINDMKQQLDDKDSKIHGMEQQLDDRDNIITEKDNEIALLRKQLEDLKFN